jgi:hypothetical protein
MRRMIVIINNPRNSRAHELSAAKFVIGAIRSLKLLSIQMNEIIAKIKEIKPKI